MTVATNININEMLSKLDSMQALITQMRSALRSTQGPTVTVGEEVDGAELWEQLTSGESELGSLSRVQLVAIAKHNGALDADTRGRPVKEMREIVKSYMDEPSAPPVTAKPAKPVIKSSPGFAPKTNTVRLPAKLTLKRP